MKYIFNQEFYLIYIKLIKCNLKMSCFIKFSHRKYAYLIWERGGGETNLKRKKLIIFSNFEFLTENILFSCLHTMYIFFFFFFRCIDWLLGQVKILSQKNYVNCCKINFDLNSRFLSVYLNCVENIYEGLLHSCLYLVLHDLNMNP